MRISRRFFQHFKAEIRQIVNKVLVMDEKKIRLGFTDQNSDQRLHCNDLKILITPFGVII
jgi:hypothetical protein